MTWPEHIVRMQQTASSLMRAGRKADAINAYKALLEAEPALPESWFNLAWLQREERHFEQAVRSYAEAIRRGVSGPEEALVNRAAILTTHLGEYREARANLESALKKAPGYLPALLNLGNLHEDLGNREEAGSAYRKAVDLAPHNALALARLANISTVASAQDPLVSQLKQALKRASHSPQERSDLGFALGRLLDACGAYDDAFAAYADANSASRSAFGQWVGYDRAAAGALVDGIIGASKTMTELPPSGENDVTPPVFICGMFRSGSTLAESLLGNHPQVEPGGELDILPALVQKYWPDFPAGSREETTHRVALIREGYSSEMDRRFDPKTLVSDKRPDNFLYVGLIKAMFPAARIVNTVRNPCDNALSVFFQALGPQFTYATNLEDIAHWYRQYRRLSAHWRELFGADFHDFDYDLLVSDPEPQVTGLLEFLDLPFDENCLAAGTGAAVVQTGSVWQVRQPLYRESSGRWRNYRKHLKPISDLLACS